MIKSIFALSLITISLAPAQTGALGGRFVSQGLSRPMGGIAPKDIPPSSGPQIYWFSYPVYIAAPFPATQPPASSPIVINQSFNLATAPEKPVAPAASEKYHYRIAYRDRSVYAATEWWIEGDVLHYITTRDAHNQASLSLIDLELTTKLNRR